MKSKLNKQTTNKYTTTLKNNKIMECNNGTEVSIKGKLIVSTCDEIKPDRCDEARGIFIYEHENGDFTDIDERDLGPASFVISKAITAVEVKAQDAEITSYMTAHPKSTLNLGLALSYKGRYSLKPMNEALSATTLSPIEQYAHSFNASDEWNFPPIIHVGRTIVRTETIAGMEINLNEQLNYLLTETTHLPIIHTSYEVAEKYLQDPVFGRFPLWLTGTKSDNPHSLPGAWKNGEWTFLELERFLETGLSGEKGSLKKERVIYGTNKFKGNEREFDNFVDGRTTTQITGRRRRFKM